MKGKSNMKELMQAVENYSITDLIVMAVLLYAAVRWLLSQIHEIRTKFDEKKKEYHKIESEKENKDANLEKRLTDIETHLKTDYERIQKSESHLYQIENYMKTLNEELTEMRIQSLRKQILDFTDKAVNVTNANISRESYDEIDRIYKTYEELLQQAGKTNGLVDYSYRCILHSLETREKNKLFLEDFYIAPAATIERLSRTSRNGSTVNDSDDSDDQKIKK